MDSLNDLNEHWKKAKQKIHTGSVADTRLILQRKNNKRSVLSFHYANSIILSVLLSVLIFFFCNYTPFRTVLSWTGVALMVGGIFIRILVEIFSARKYAGIHVEEDTVSATEASLAFYRFRKKIHGPLTITIVGFYIAGFYMLSPEFSLYFSLPLMLFMDIGFAVGAVILSVQIRKGIKKEMKTLESLTVLQKDMRSGE